MSLLKTLWTYQSERFPLAKTVPLLAVFSAASINVSAFLAGRDLPELPTYLTGFALALILFFQMRVADEVKDAEDDAKYRPERPIPRWLVSLRTIVICGLATIPIAVLIALPASGLTLLLLTWAWLAAMTFEFGVPEWLKARAVLYLLSHMAIMPLIDLLLTGLEWRPSGGPARALSPRRRAHARVGARGRRGGDRRRGPRREGPRAWRSCSSALRLRRSRGTGRSLASFGSTAFGSTSLWWAGRRARIAR